MKQQNNSIIHNMTEVIVHGMVVQLIFAEHANMELPKLVREFLKSSYIQQMAGHGDVV